DDVARIGLDTLRDALNVIARSRAGEVLIGRILDSMVELLNRNVDRIHLAVEREALWWMPRSTDRRIAEGILGAMEDFINDLRRPDSDSRQSFHTEIEALVQNLARREPNDDGVDCRSMIGFGLEVWLSLIQAQLRQIEW